MKKGRKPGIPNKYWANSPDFPGRGPLRAPVLPPLDAPRKDDGEKTRLDLLSVPALLGISDVLTHGAKKYADNNWRSGEGLEWHRLIRAALKHLLAFQAGEDLDTESGLPHIDHLLCTAMFLSEYQKTGLGKDDRWKVKGKFS